MLAEFRSHHRGVGFVAAGDQRFRRVQVTGETAVGQLVDNDSFEACHCLHIQAVFYEGFAGDTRNAAAAQVKHLYFSGIFILTEVKTDTVLFDNYIVQLVFRA